MVSVKDSSWVRWPVLALACLMLIGSYYSAEMPAALKQQLEDYFGNPGDFETLFSLMYSLYSIPNIFLPFFGGYFVDRFGVRICLLVFTVLITIGQVFVSLGVSIKSWGVIFLGRIFFGFGGECLIVANSALLADWFRGTELAFAFGINLSIARLGSVSTNLISPGLAEDVSLEFACWFGVMLCAMSVLCVVTTIPIDRHFDNLKKKAGQVLLLPPDDDGKYAVVNPVQNEESNGEYGGVTTEPETVLVQQPPQPRFADILKFRMIFWILCVSCVCIYGVTNPFNIVSATLLLERDYFVVPPSNCALQHPGYCQNATNLPDSSCPSSSWYQPPLPVGTTTAPFTMCGSTFTYALTEDDIDCSKDCWKDGCAVEFCDRLAKSEKQAALIMSIPYIISASLSPFLGLFVDYCGMRAIIIALASVFVLMVHTLLGFSTIGPVFPLVGQGLAYTGFAAVLWPAVPLVVEEEYTGLAFGVVTSVVNLACAVIPLIVAAVYNDSNHKYIPNVEVVFMIEGILGILNGIYLNYNDYFHNDSVLNRGLVKSPDKDKEDTSDSANLLGPSISMDGRERISSRDSRDGRTLSKEEHHQLQHSTRAARRSKGSFTAQEEVFYGGAFEHVVPDK